MNRATLDFRPKRYSMRDVLFDRLPAILSKRLDHHSLVMRLQGLDDLALKLALHETLSAAEFSELFSYADVAVFELGELRNFQDATREMVEVAVITWRLLTMCDDPVIIYSRVKDGVYRYRIVSESGVRYRIRYPRLPQPLPLGRFIRMIDEAVACDEDGAPMEYETLHHVMFECNSAAGFSREECSFPMVLSAFYSGLEAHYEAEADRFLEKNFYDEEETSEEEEGGDEQATS